VYAGDKSPAYTRTEFFRSPISPPTFLLGPETQADGLGWDSVAT